MAVEPNREIDDEIEIDLYAYLMLLKSGWKKLLAGLLAGALAAVVYAMFLVTPMYQSTAAVYLRGNSASLSLQDLQVGTQLTKDYEIIFKSRPILEQTISELNLDMEPKELSEAITIRNPADSRILQISAVAQSPDLAKDIANSIMNNGVDTVLEIDAQEPYVIEKGIASTEKVGLSRTKMVLIGGLGGMVLVAGLIFVKFMISDTIKSAEDVEHVLGVPVLTVVSEDESLNYAKNKKGRRK